MIVLCEQISAILSDIGRIGSEEPYEHHARREDINGRCLVASEPTSTKEFWGPEEWCAHHSFGILKGDLTEIGNDQVERVHAAD